MLQVQAIENLVIIAVRLCGADTRGACTIETTAVLQAVKKHMFW